MSEIINTTKRNFEQIENQLALARIASDRLKPVVQRLTFSDNFNDNNFKLMEVDDFLLEHITSGKHLSIRGEHRDSAVICTDDRTYEVKEADTSNSCLLLSKWVWPELVENGTNGKVVIDREVKEIHHTYYELRHCKPRLRKLRALLEMNPFRGKEYEDGNDAQLFTLEDLRNVVQASNDELDKGLQHLQACIINGAVRVLDFDYKFQVFSLIMHLVDSNSWPIDKIPLKCTLDTLEDLAPRDVIESCLKWYADYTGLEKEDGDKFYRFNEREVCRIYAEALLRPVREFNLKEFLENWQRLVPEGMVTDLSQLKGLALTKLNVVPQVIFFYPEWKLPEVPKERFQALFKVYKTWSREDIKPYFEDLVSEDKELDHLLAKYARTCKSHGATVYCSRLPIGKRF